MIQKGTVPNCTILLYLQRWNTIDDFEAALDEYIKYYNNDSTFNQKF